MTYDRCPRCGRIAPALHTDGDDRACVERTGCDGRVHVDVVEGVAHVQPAPVVEAPADPPDALPVVLGLVP